MDGNVIKKLEEMGRIKVIQKPKYIHTSTKEEYSAIQREVSEHLNFVRLELEKHQNKVKIHITNIGIKAIKNAFSFYLNLRTNAENTEFNRRFLKNFTEIKNIVNRTPGLDEETKSKIDDNLESVKKKFVDQLTYIKSLEEDIAAGIIKPSKNQIEIIKLR